MITKYKFSQVKQLRESRKVFMRTYLIAIIHYKKNKQTDKQTDRQTNKQTDRQIDRHDKNITSLHMHSYMWAVSRNIVHTTLKH